MNRSTGASATATWIATATNSEWMSLTYRALHRTVPGGHYPAIVGNSFNPVNIHLGVRVGPVYFRHLAGVLREYEDDLTPLRMLGGRVDCARKAMGLGLYF